MNTERDQSETLSILMGINQEMTQNFQKIESSNK